MDSLLSRRITLDQDVRLPEHVPRRAMFAQQVIEPPAPGIFGHNQIIRSVATPSGARHGDEFGEDVRPAPLDIHADMKGEPIAVMVNCYRSRTPRLREGYRSRHRHGQALLGLAVEPQ